MWFAGNAIYPDLEEAYSISFSITPYLTTAVQLGFILGTLSYAILMIPDRFSPVKVFLISALFSSLFNFATLFSTSFMALFFSRLGVGFFLAGIYPVGMKIAADWSKEGLGNVLGFLVGALVLGTGFPHLIKFVSGDFPWQLVIVSTSTLAVISGVLVWTIVEDGPYRQPLSKFSIEGVFALFRIKSFRSAALGYFGHMWELYAFWAFLPLILFSYKNLDFDISLVSFLIISLGAVSCIVGGMISKKIGSAKVALTALCISCLCALGSGFIHQLPSFPFLLFLGVWGFFIIQIRLSFQH